MVAELHNINIIASLSYKCNINKKKKHFGDKLHDY
jgi:hypothetical protein